MSEKPEKCLWAAVRTDLAAAGGEMHGYAIARVPRLA